MKIFGLDFIPSVLVIAAITVVGVAILVLLYFLFLRNRALVHQVKEMDKKYEFLHTLLSAQDAHHLKRIEYIAQINLLYGPIHQKQEERFNNLLNSSDAYVGNKLQEFKSNLSSQRYIQVRKEFPDFKKYVLNFEEEVNNFNNDLLQIIRPEEECNKMLNEAQESFAIVKKEYSNNEEILKIVRPTYEEAFKYVEKLFDDFTQYVEEADYEEATNLMPSIKKVINELIKINQTLPQLCSLVNRDVPQRITDLENEAKHLRNEGYVIDHIVTGPIIASMREKVQHIKKDLKCFVYKNSNEKLDQIMRNIDNCFLKFNEERDARKKFDDEFSPIYSRINIIEKSFIKLCNSLPKIKTIYIINNEKAQMRSQIQMHINRIGVSKRSLDASYHNSTRQPFSALLKKVLSLKEEAEQIEKEMNEFKSYLSSLKEDTQKAHELVSEFYYRARKAEKMIRDISIPVFKAKYQGKIDEIYSYLDLINKTTLETPIDVEKVNNAVNYILYQGESSLNQIEQDKNMLNLAESSITYLNAYRNKFQQLNTLVLQSEKMFFDGEFEKAYNQASDTIKRYNELEN